jgi:mono/diheme cytochrome c family protein
MAAIPPDVIADDVLAALWDWLDEPPQPTTGEALYLDYCANCHGADGNGGPTERPILEELDELGEQVREGSHNGEFANRREFMPAVPTARLSDAEVQLIRDYVGKL